MSVDELFGSEITQEIKALARQRIRFGGNLASEERGVAKLALLLVKTVNPMEKLKEEEEAILLGVSRPTLRKIKSGI
jgi:hypothetical protein